MATRRMNPGDKLLHDLATDTEARHSAKQKREAEAAAPRTDYTITLGTEGDTYQRVASLTKREHDELEDYLSGLVEANEEDGDGSIETFRIESDEIPREDSLDALKTWAKDVNA